MMGQVTNILADGQTVPQQAAPDNGSAFIDDLKKHQVPHPDAKPSDATLKQAVEEGVLLPVGRDELLPNAASNTLFSKKDAEGHDLPIYVKPGVGASEIGPNTAREMLTDKGKSFLMIDEGYHKIPNEQYAADHLMSSTGDMLKKNLVYDAKSPEAALAEALKGKEGTPEAAAIQSRYDKMIATIQEQKDSLGPDVMTSVSSAVTSSNQTKEGQKFHNINEEAFKAALNSDEKTEQLRGEIGHELDHLKKGDRSAAGIMAQHNNPAVTREFEMRADIEGTGPAGTRNPDALAQDLKNITRENIPDYNLGHSNARISETNPSDKDLRTVSSWVQTTQTPDHPDLMDRVDALKESSALMKKYEAEHPGATSDKAGRQAESDAILGQVMHDFKDKVDKAPTVPVEPKGGPFGLNQSQLDKIQGIRTMLGGMNAHHVSDNVTAASVVPVSLPSGGRSVSA